MLSTVKKEIVVYIVEIGILKNIVRDFNCNY